MINSMKALFPIQAVRRAASRCTLCGAPVDATDPAAFTDPLSAKEFTISGTCQRCQDVIFSGGDEE